MLKAEQICHINAVNRIRFEHPEIKEDIYHFANERKCSIQQGRTLKRMSVQPGVSDLFIGVPRHGKAGLWMEIKVNDNYATKEQKTFLEKQVKNNFAAACCWELEGVMFVVKQYLSDESINNLFDQVIYQKSV